VSKAASDPEARPRIWTMSGVGHESHRALATVIVAITLLATAVITHETLLVAPIGVALAAHLNRALRSRFRVSLGVVGHAALLGAVALLYQVHPVSGLADGRFNYSFYIAYAGVVLATAKLYAPPSRTLLPRIVLYCSLSCGFLAVGLPSYVRDDPQWAIAGSLTPPPTVFYAGLVAALGVHLVVALRVAIRLRRGTPGGKRSRASLTILSVSVVLVGALTGAGAWAENAYYQEIANIYTNLLTGGPNGGGGFSDQANLGSVVRTQKDGGRSVALRVFAERVPGYLRARAFLRYKGRGWSGEWTAEDTSRAPRTPPDRYGYPGRRALTPTETPALTVHSVGDFPTQFFLPLEASGVETKAPLLGLNTPGYTLRGQGASDGYGVFLDTSPNHSESDLPAYVELPGDKELVSSVDAKLAALNLNSSTDARHAVAVLAGHFQMRYRYELGVDFEPGSDPMTQFLNGVDQGGHCELFASAGTLLLRRLGVPARYVTGFVCEERNPVGEDLWIARDRYAHAWVEFHEPQSGWQVAEFTPAGGVPVAKPESGLGALSEWLGAAWSRLKAVVVDLPRLMLAGLKSALAWVAASWWRIALVVLAIAFAVFARRLASREPQEAERERTFSPEVASERERYQALEAQLRAAGLGRKDWETLLEYASRLEGEQLPDGVPPSETLGFLRGFALLRYGAAPAPSA
jgi:transglutaminase-like putative cysteine protease